MVSRFRFNDIDPEKGECTDSKPPKSVSTYTGLSQSNSSLNQPSSYRYGNQQGYDNGYYGYPVYNGYINDDMIIAPTNKPKPSAVQCKENGRLLHGYSIDNGQPILLSDIQAENERRCENGPVDASTKLRSSISQDSNSESQIQEEVS